MKILADADYDALAAAVKARKIELGVTLRALAGALDMAYPVALSALYEYTQPSALLRMARYFGLPCPSIGPLTCLRGHRFERDSAGKIIPCRVCHRDADRRRRARNRGNR